MPTFQFQSEQVNFESYYGGEHTTQVKVTFPTNVSKVESMIQGYNIQYNNGDHYILRNEIATSVTFSGKDVFLTVTILLRDNSGNVDDPYSGWVDVLVCAEMS